MTLITAIYKTYETDKAGLPHVYSKRLQALIDKDDKETPEGMVGRIDWDVFIDWRISPLEGQQSMSDLASDFRLRPRSWLTLESLSRYNIEDGQFRLSYSSFTVQPNDIWSWTFGHFYMVNDFRPSPYGWGEGNNVFRNSLTFRVNQNWALRATQHYNADDGVLEEQSYSIYRDLNQKAISLLFDQGPVKGITGKRDHLKVIAQGDQFAFYVNDLLIGSVTDQGPTRGRVGLEFGSFDANGSVAFSNFKLTQINVPFPMPPPSAQAAPVPPPQPTASAKYPLPAGKGGLIVRNFYGGQADFTINNQTYILPPSGGEVFIVLDPGHYTWSSHLPGVGQAHGTVDITAGQTRVLPFADRT